MDYIKYIKKVKYHFAIILLALLFPACHSSKKLNFMATRSYGQIRQSDSLYPPVSPSNPVAYNTMDVIYPVAPENMTASLEKIVKVSTSSHTEIISDKSPYVKAPHLSVREIRRELRSNFKTYYKENKERQKLSTTTKTKDAYTTKAVVLTVVGLAVIITGILLVNSLGVLPGAIIAGVGLVVFLLGLLKLLL